MVKGLDVFRNHFKNFTDSFVIIGGTACSLLLESVGLAYRVTKDIDIILYVETLEPRFGIAFWDFVKKGGYKHLQKSTGKKIFYRFFEPTIGNYPEMLELFSSKPKGFEIAPGSQLTPIPFNDEVSSLSAILLDSDYYPFIQRGRKIIEDLPVLGPEFLIPLKAKAYLDLSKRRGQGEAVDAKNIRKHQNDVFRLFSLLTEETRVELPSAIAKDMNDFLIAMNAAPVDLKTLKIETFSFPEVIKNLKTIYRL